MAERGEGMEKKEKTFVNERTQTRPQCLPSDAYLTRLLLNAVKLPSQ